MWGSGVLTAVSQVPRHQRSQMFGTFTYTYTVRPATKFVTVTQVGRGAFPTRTNYGYYDYMGHSVRGLIFLGLFCPGHYVRGALCPVFGSAVIASIICVGPAVYYRRQQKSACDSQSAYHSSIRVQDMQKSEMDLGQIFSHFCLGVAEEDVQKHGAQHCSKT